MTSGQITEARSGRKLPSVRGMTADRRRAAKLLAMQLVRVRQAQESQP